MGRMNEDKIPKGNIESHIDIEPVVENLSTDKPPKPIVRTTAQVKAEQARHDNRVEKDLIKIATIAFMMLFITIIGIVIIEYLAYGFAGWTHNDFLRETIRWLTSIVTLIIGFLFGTNRRK